MKKKILPVPVLAEPTSPINRKGEQTTSGEARESTDTKLKRSVEQVASEPRGGQYIQELKSGELADGAGTWKTRNIYSKPSGATVTEWKEACERAQRATDYATMFPHAACASQEVYQSPLWQWENRVKPFDTRNRK